MTKQGKLLCLKARRASIIKRSKFKKMPGALQKVERQIKNLEVEIAKGE